MMVLAVVLGTQGSMTTQLAIAIVSNMLTAPLTLLINLIFTRMLLPPRRVHAAKVGGAALTHSVGCSSSGGR